ncbi:MAG TPA: methionyl-tRNA formyltransferase [Candidatus Paceibacterota bacterium]|nr:methionyl-tRNA formyltransferase [Candidatus Paceibacterota bacterium]HPT40212.1 methionyl-tRNA formyltransferase [Candidatus Paceibacterota bacterium]
MKNSNKTKIIYWGTSYFSAEILTFLIDNGFKPIGVITQMDKPAGRGSKLKSPEVKMVADKLSIPCFQPKKLKEAMFIEQIKELSPDLFVVVSYGKIIPKEILSIPSLGTINVHPSCLPHWRGPSPIQSAILNGDKETGTTIMLLDEEMDHGPILASAKINDDISKLTYKDLESILIKESSKLLLKVLPKWISGEIKPIPQDDAQATYCRMIKKDDGKIDWNESIEVIDRKIRALNPWPGTYFEIKGGKKFKVLEAQISQEKNDEKKNGEFFCVNKQLLVKCKNGALIIKSIQPESKNAMDGFGFWCGYQNKL